MHIVRNNDNWTVCHSELYEAERWNSDDRFKSPMALCDGARKVFVDDIVTIDDLCYGKIKKFITDVRPLELFIVL